MTKQVHEAACSPTFGGVGAGSVGAREQYFLNTLRKDVELRLSSNGNNDRDSHLNWLTRRKKEWTRERMGLRLLHDIQDEIFIHEQVKDVLCSTLDQLVVTNEEKDEKEEGVQVEYDKDTTNKPGSKQWLMKRKAMWDSARRVRKLTKCFTTACAMKNHDDDDGGDIQWLTKIVSRGFMSDGGVSLLPSTRNTLISFYMKHNPSKIQHVDDIINSYTANDGPKKNDTSGANQMWIDFNKKYSIDPRDFISQQSKTLLNVEKHTSLEILEVVEELITIVEDHHQ